MKTGSDIDLVKRQIEAQLAEYEREIADFAAFMAEWRARTEPDVQTSSAPEQVEG